MHDTRGNVMTKGRLLAVLVLIILLGAFLRWADLSRMTDMLGYDESYYAADAASLLDRPRLTPYFSGNNGRESGWMYVLAAFMWGVGETPFTAHLATTFAGVLSIAAVYRLGKELFDARVGLGAAAGMAVLYWPVHISHIAMRANLLPLLGALSLALLLTAHRNNRWRCWVASGLVIGATTYSYISAYAWIAVELVILLGWIATSKLRRRGAIVAFVIAIALAVPLAIYALQQPDQVFMRTQQSATISNPSSFDCRSGCSGALIGAGEAWLNAWFTRGDILLNHNIPGRPILDWATGILFAIGLIGLFFTRRPWSVLLILVLACISIVPSLLSEFPPHFLRSIGLTVPVALVLGVGASAWVRLISLALARLRLAYTLSALTMIVPAGLFAASAFITYRDFHEVWLNLPEITEQFERPAHRAAMAINHLKPSLPDDTPIYFSPYELTHPVIQFNRYVLSPHRVGAFKYPDCLIVPDSPAIYVALLEKDASLSGALTEWGRIKTLASTAATSTGESTVIEFIPRDGALLRTDDWVVQFGEAIELRATPTASATMRPGDQAAWQFRLRAVRPLDQPYSLFVHLYRLDATGVVDDTYKWAQGDQQLCASYPTTLWQPNEVAIQTYNLGLPPDLPEGQYVVAVGVYDSETGERLGVNQSKDYALLQHIQVSRQSKIQNESYHLKQANSGDGSRCAHRQSVRRHDQAEWSDGRSGHCTRLTRRRAGAGHD